MQDRPALKVDGLRPAQVGAIRAIERSLAEQRLDRSLVQMAAGAGKTYTAVTLAYRLLRYGGFRRVLFVARRGGSTCSFTARLPLPPRTASRRVLKDTEFRRLYVKN